MAIAVNTSLQYGNVGYEQGLPVMDNWEDFFNDIVSDIQMKGVSQVSCSAAD
jgi:hypothetical protein